MLIAGPLLGSGTIRAALFVAFYLAVVLSDGVVCCIVLVNLEPLGRSFVGICGTRRSNM